jgi:protein-export membrane protein SecD
MKIPSLLKDWRVLLFVAAIIISLALIAPIQKPGVLVKSVSTDSPFYGKVSPGEYITWAGSKAISAPEDLQQFENFAGTLFFQHSGKGGLDSVVLSGSGLGLDAVKPSATRLNLGMDLIGGTRVLLKVQENASDAVVEQAVATLQTRINIYGLREAKFQAVKQDSTSFIQIEMAGGSKQEIDNLLSKQGKFEAYIPKLVGMENGSGLLMVNGTNYTVSMFDNSTTVQNIGTVNINDTFTLNDISFTFLNYTNSTAVFNALAFNGTDVKSVCMQSIQGICSSTIQPTEGGFQFSFQVTISKEGAQRFAALTKDMRIVFDPERKGYVLENGFIDLYLDKRLITELSISRDLKGKAITDPAITGFKVTQADAIKEKLTLQSILQSGVLPVTLSVERVDQISASLGSEFIRSVLLAGAIAAAAVIVVVFIRYRNLRITIPMIMTSLSEVIIILGAASLIGWTIDIAAIAGIIAVIGTGVDAQIMIIDELITGRERIFTFKERIKKAFFMIFSSAATVVAAMLPLLFIGIGVMRGFAITTLLGVFIGVFIARPAFSRIAEKILESPKK